MITNIPRLLGLDTSTGKYSVNLQFSWEGQTPYSINFPSILFTGQGIEDDFDMLSVLGNVRNIPPVQSMMGTLCFRQNQQTVGDYPGPLAIRTPDTGQQLVLAQNTNVGGFQPSNTVPITGIVGVGYFTFSIPVITNGTSFQFIKALDTLPASMHGTADITLYTFPISNFVWRGL